MRIIHQIEFDNAYLENYIDKQYFRLLHDLKGKAAFVTVSGEMDNTSQPEKLYRKCGFSGNDIWHIMCKK